MKERPTIVLGGAWLAVATSVLGVGLLPSGHRMAAYLAVHAALFGLSLALYARASPSSARTAVVLGAIAQLILVLAPPLTSTDSARYVWDGAVVLEGMDPYRTVPDDVRLDALAERFDRPIDHRDVPTCYPPVALALFTVVAATGRALAPILLSLILALAASALIWLVHRALEAKGQSADVILLALSPLVLLETGVGTHVEILVALALTLAALHAARDRGMAAGLMIGLAAMIKVWPLVLCLVLWRHVARGRFAAGLALGLSPFALATLALGHPPLGSLSLMAQTWSFGSPAWWIVRSLSDDEPALRLGLAAASGLACIAIGWRARSPAGGLLAGVLAVLLASPTLYPWYAVSLVPLALLAPRLRALGLGLGLVLPFSYEVVDGYQRDGVWQPAAWPVAMTLALLVALLANEVRKRLRPPALDEVSVA